MQKLNHSAIRPLGIALDADKFRNAIAKAETVKPRVYHAPDDGGHYYVQRSDGGTAVVIFRYWQGRIWASCTCPAGQGVGRLGEPQPCYHIAAAAIAKLSPAPLSTPRLVENAEGMEHKHFCSSCHELYVCSCNHAEIDDLTCAICDEYEADQLIAA